MHSRRAEHNYRTTQSKENNYTFVDLCENLSDMIENEDML